MARYNRRLLYSQIWHRRYRREALSSISGGEKAGYSVKYQSPILLPCGSMPEPKAACPIAVRPESRNGYS